MRDAGSTVASHARPNRSPRRWHRHHARDRCPALAATTVNEKLTEYKISDASSAPAGRVTFRTTNSGEDEHELVVIKTTTRASELKVNEEGEASEKGRRGKVTVAAGETKSLRLTLSKGHYALMCNIGDHYTSGMRKDFTAK